MKEINVEVEGLPETRKMLDEIAARAQDFTPVFEAVAADYPSEMASEFDSEGGYGPSGAWEPLSAYWRQRKADLGLSSAILQATGRLRASLAEGTSDTVTEIEPLNLQLGTQVEYAGFVTGGTDKIPARPIEPSEAKTDEWFEWFNTYLHEGNL